MAAGASPMGPMILQMLMQKLAGAGGPGASGGAPGGMSPMPPMPPGGPSGPMAGPMPGGSPSSPPGAGPGPVPGAGGPTMGMPSQDDSSQAQLSSELAKMRQVDPGALLGQFTDMKKTILTYIVHSGMSFPGCARALSKMLPGIDAAIKEAQQAAATAAVTGPPINSSSVPSTMGLAPGAGAGGPSTSVGSTPGGM